MYFKRINVNLNCKLTKNHANPQHIKKTVKKKSPPSLILSTAFTLGIGRCKY